MSNCAGTMRAYKKGDDPRFITEWVREGDHQFMCECCGQLVHADELVEAGT